MPELTKKLPINNPVELRFIGPSENQEKAVRYLKRMGFTDVSDSRPFREVFLEDCDEEELPGLALVGARCKEDITQKELSKLTGIRTVSRRTLTIYACYQDVKSYFSGHRL